jgi:glycerophosphoryl diester phosphodiesterase
MNRFLTLALSLTLLYNSNAVMGQTKIIAHKGYWDCAGSAENSVTSLRKAQELKVYGSEFDVHVTKDDVAVIYHDDTLNGLSIEQSTYQQLKEFKLANGESLPTLEQYLVQAQQSKATKLILEIKPHQTKATEDKAVAVIQALVNKHRLEKRTEYISFSLNICKELIRREPGVQVAYLRGELAPEALKPLGFTGLDYHFKVLQEHPEWIKAAHDLGLSVNVWTINDLTIMQSFIDQGVDYITTDKPTAMEQLLRK